MRETAIDTNGIQILDLNGSPIERGRQFGEACKEKIHSLVETHHTSLAKFAQTRANISLSREQVPVLSNRYLPYIQEYAPDLVEEMRGIAQSADLPFHEIFFLNCFLDIYDLIFPGISHPLLFGCTTFAATKPITTGGKTIVAQNLDLREFFKDYSIIVRIRPDEGPNILCFTMAGVLGLAGFNNSGISLVFNKLVPKDTGYGVPYPIMARKVLEQSRMGKALNAIARVKRASGSYCLVGSPQTGIFGVECTGRHYQVFYPENGFLAHANHYIHPGFYEQNHFYYPFAGDSFVRLNQAEQSLRNQTNLDTDFFMGVAKGHANFPDSICRHPDDESEPFSKAMTMASIIIEAGCNSCLISKGPPCESEYHSISL